MPGMKARGCRVPADRDDPAQAAASALARAVEFFTRPNNPAHHPEHREVLGLASLDPT
jgi:hypothetical protein